MHNITFVKSALEAKDWPILRADSGAPLAEVAVVGRSNVGKSSLLNHLFQRKTIARVSTKPGKTTLLNFFKVGRQFALVDCPGYGYAKVPTSVQKKWGRWVEAYLTEREELTLILFLLDIRRKPTEEDLMFFRWAEHYNKPIQIILTKVDKVKKTERKNFRNTILETLSKEGITLPHPPLLYTVKNGEGRAQLIELLRGNVWDSSTKTPLYA